MHTFRCLQFAALLLVLGACRCAMAAEAADRQALEAAVQAWTEAFNARNADGMLALTTENVVLMGPDVPPVSGRRAARAHLARAVGTAKGQLTNVTKEIVTAGDFAWRIATLTHEPPRRELRSAGQALEIWKREPGGWRLHRQMSSGLLAQPKFGRKPDPSEPVLDQPD
jgi:ketosteroid isomerase-like protein